MLIRPALVSDEADVTALWRRCGLAMPWNDIEAECRLARGRANSDILVAEANHQVVGSVMVGHEGHRGWLYYVATDPAWRGQGVARQLIQHAEDWLKLRGLPKVQLLVRATNTAVMQYYEALGYKSVPSALMQKQLD
jgi:ribosomal protein S18 acetylase RimI-like enzyme